VSQLGSPIGKRLRPKASDLARVWCGVHCGAVLDDSAEIHEARRRSERPRVARQLPDSELWAIASSRAMAAGPRRWLDSSWTRCLSTRGFPPSSLVEAPRATELRQTACALDLAGSPICVQRP
jgi:hypothetical protein